jgi:hypothetical protein
MPGDRPDGRRRVHPGANRGPHTHADLDAWTGLNLAASGLLAHQWLEDIHA